jgi:anaerobic selenocysteine-containing dehydrogenase
MPKVVRAACPHDCPDTCAMLVTVEEGVATRVAGDPEHPVTAGFLCGKVSNYLDRVYHPDRLLTPLVREGAKGEARFRPASWEEALDRVAAGLNAAIERHGPESVLPYSYFGTMGYLQRGVMAARLFNALGASELQRTICASAGVAGVMATMGPSPEVDPERWIQAKTIVCWGWNPLSTAPHLWRFILEARRRGARLVVVDPYRSRTARLADQHVRPVPGTDAALALGMMRAMLDAGLADEAWCRAHATGYDQLEARLREHPVEHWAALSGVPAVEVAELGRAFARDQPSLLRLGVGAQRHMGAPIAYRTLACLPALAGSWRHEGGGLSYVPTAVAGAIDSSRLDGRELRSRPGRVINMSELGRALCDPDLTPPVAALVVWNSNPAQTAPDQLQVLAGLRRPDLFTVVLEQFMTDTARHADVVLPACSQLEQLDALFSWGHHYLTMNEPAIAPRGEALPNSEIFRRLAARLGLAHASLRESDEQVLAALFADRPAGVELAALRARGWAKIDLGQGAAPHAEGRFATADGKLQLRADALARAGIDPLPHHAPAREVADPALAARFPLALITPKTHLFLNSTFANQRRQLGAQPEPYVVLHPDDAAARGIVDGGLVRIHNDRGAFVARARVSDDTMPGVAVAPTGWWCAHQRGADGAQATTSQVQTDVLIRAPTFNDNRVEAERWSRD